MDLTYPSSRLNLKSQPASSKSKPTRVRTCLLLFCERRILDYVEGEREIGEAEAMLEEEKSSMRREAKRRFWQMWICHTHCWSGFGNGFFWIFPNCSKYFTKSSFVCGNLFYFAQIVPTLPPTKSWLICCNFCTKPVNPTYWFKS